MLMWALLLHLAIHLLSAANNAPAPLDTSVRPIDSHSVVRPIKTCPEDGYFFQKEKIDDQNFCFLCFCKSEHTAVCWKRDNKRCDSSAFNHHGVGKRPMTRVRRSADLFGLSDLFFRDTARSLFNKDTKQECKPHESSFSEGCPPKDWCVGCTVCDCDVNGHWDCHILSFCPEKKSGSKGKRRVQKVTPKPKTLKPSPKRTNNVPKKTTPKKSNIKPTNNRGVKNQPKVQRKMVKKTIPKVGTKKPLVKSQVKHTKKKMVTQKTAAPKYMNKQVRPMKIKRSQGNKLVLNENNSTVKLAKQILASVMMAAKRKVGHQMRNVSRSMFVTTKPMKKPGKRQVQKKNSPKKVLVKKYRIRNKRDLPALNVVDNNASILIEKPSLLNKSSPTDKPTSITNLEGNVYTILELTNQTKYYTYIVDSNQPTTKIFVNKSNNGVNNTETVLNSLTTRNIDSLSKEPVKIKRNSSETLVHTSIIVNDVKSNSNYSLNNIDDTVTYNMERPIARAEPIKNYTYENPSVLPLIHSKDVSREPASKKYQIVKIVPHKTKTAELKKDRSTMQQMIRDKIVAMHKTVKTLFNHIYINNDTSMHTTKRKHKKITLIKYMKKFFNKVFIRKQYNTESQAIKSLCEAFGRCELNYTEKRIIRSKLKSLNKEASNILKSIGIIKGLLHLIPIPLNNTSSNTTSPSLGNDLQKLDSILKGTYLDNNYKLSESELVQINYVKKNTQEFIQSMSKLATKLDEIIAIIKSTKKKRRKVTNSNDIDQIKVSIKNPFNRIKSLIMSYNLAHNKFMEKLEKALKDIEYNFKDKRVHKVSHDDNKNINNTVAVEVFSRNIINNLRHLKGLAQKMIFNNRNKRHVRSVARENESMEYLLMLMEYLMKRSHPLNNAPAHDGIDLLIDAIKSAPDIKPIQKIELKPTLASINETSENRTILNDNIKPKDTYSNNVNMFLRNTFDDYDNQLEVNNSKEDSIKSVFSSSKESDQSLKFDKEVERNNQLYRNIDSVTVPILFKHVDDFGKTELVDSFVTTTESVQSSNELNKQSGSLDYDNSDKFDVIKDGMDSEAKGNENRQNISESHDEENVSKLETDVKEAEFKKVIPETKRKDIKLIEQDLDSSFYNDVILDVKSTVAPKHTTPHFFETQTVRALSDSDKQKPESEYKNKLSESKSPIDWIEENFGIETKTSQRSFQPLKLTTVPSTTEVTVKNTEVTRAATHATSFMAEERKKKKKVINVEDVIFKKQMALLNSLDYGTEKSPFDDTDSKDERSGSDSYQVYN